MRIWDIVDKTQPGVEITQRVEAPVRFSSPGAPFKLSVASLVLATATAFWLPIPRQAVIVSASTQTACAETSAPPLSFWGRSLSPDSSAEHNNLLDKIETARYERRSAEQQRLDTIEANQQESLQQTPTFTRSQVIGILEKRRVG